MKCGALLGCLFLAGCAGGGISADRQPPPDAKAIILANKGRLWKDPDSIKNASIGEPTRFFDGTWHVCVRLNAKNAFGGYTGERDNVIVIADGAPPYPVSDEHAPICDGVPHQPFPELEGSRPAAPAAKQKHS